MTDKAYYEFFAGGGMVRAGLGGAWTCLFANDVDEKKGSSYADNWGGENLLVEDVKLVKASDLPPGGDLIWASFPCQDLSQAGAGAGLKGHRSGTFWPFWKLVQALGSGTDRPPIVVLENVPGAITSHDGKDFSAICDALAAAKYKFGAVLVDAALFVPQSRVRLFVIAVSESLELGEGFASPAPTASWHSRSLIKAVAGLSRRAAKRWVWWSLPMPPARTVSFADILLPDDAATWHAPAETAKILAMMSDLHVAKVDAAKKANKRVVGSIYKRRRVEASGERFQRAEVRFDDIAGCLRTPTGGSSRQTIIVVEGESVRTRFLQPREAARLMGLKEDYSLPENYYDAYHLVGDGVAVPVVKFLAQSLLGPILESSRPEVVEVGPTISPAPPIAAPVKRLSWSQRHTVRHFRGRQGSATRTDARSS